MGYQYGNMDSEVDIENLVLLTNLMFSEVGKDNIDRDAPAVAWTVMNRMKNKNPRRFGSTVEEVVHQPKQFSGVNTPEWYKATTGNMTDKESSIYQKLMGIADEVMRGEIKDPTGGANHYYNPELVTPGWASEMKETYQYGSHRYMKGN